MARRSGTNLSPALAASAALHLGVAVLLFVSWQAAKEIEIPPVVPVTIMTGPTGEAAEMAPAEAPAEAQSPTVAPAPPEPPTPPAPAPQPAPTPPPPRPQPRPKPTLAPAKPAPRTPAKPAPAKPRPAEPDFDLDALARSVAGSTTRRPSRAAPAPAARQGPPQAAAGQSTELSGAELGALKSKLERLWNPNCTVAGAESIVIRVRLRLSPEGRLTRPAEVVGRRGSAGPEVLEAAADRAVSAVSRGAPYDELPAEKYEGWKDIVLNFNGRTACRGR